MEKFRKKNDFYDYSEDFGLKPNRYDKKKRDKTKELSKRNKEYDPYEVDWYNDARRFRK